jgi:hypothetical protein
MQSPAEQAEFLVDLVGEITSLKTPGSESGRAEARYTLLVAHVRRPLVQHTAPDEK